MEKERAANLLNEALSGRGVTGTGLAVADLGGYGDLVVPYLEFDWVIRVALSLLYVMPEEGEQSAVARGLEQRYMGQEVSGVVITSRGDGRKFAEIHLSEEEVLLPIRNVDFLRSEGECELDDALITAGLQAPLLWMSNDLKKALISAGLQAPFPFLGNDGNNEDEDGEDESA